MYHDGWLCFPPNSSWESFILHARALVILLELYKLLYNGCLWNVNWCNLLKKALVKSARTVFFLHFPTAVLHKTSCAMMPRSAIGSPQISNSSEVKGNSVCRSTSAAMVHMKYLLKQTVYNLQQFTIIYKRVFQTGVCEGNAGGYWVNEKLYMNQNTMNKTKAVI